MSVKTEAIINAQIETEKPGVGVFELPLGVVLADGTRVTNVTIKELTGVEEDLLASGNSSNALQVMEKVITNCIVSLGDIEHHLIPSMVKNMTVGDRTFLLFAIRRVTFGDTYPFDFTCPSCSHKESLQISLGSLETKVPEDPAQRVFSAISPTGMGIAYHIATGVDEAKSVSSREKGSVLSRAIMLRLDLLNGDVPTLEAVKALSMRDRMFIRKEFDANDGGVDTTLELTCSACSFETKSELELMPDFFFPSEM